MSYSVILPTLNEKNHIINLIEEISKIFVLNKKDYEIIIVDDNSSDGTIDVIKDYVKKKNNIKLFVRFNEKKNLAKSLDLGIQKSLFENIIWMDADFQHPPQYINEFIKKSQFYDLVLCSRFLSESKRYFEKDSNVKELNENQSIFFNKLCKIFLYKDLTDYTSGFICIKKNIFNNYNLRGHYGDYFIDLLVHCKKIDKKIIEIPFIEKIRSSGESKTVINFSFTYLYTCFHYFLCFIKNIFKKIW